MTASYIKLIANISSCFANAKSSIQLSQNKNFSRYQPASAGS